MTLKKIFWFSSLLWLIATPTIQAENLLEVYHQAAQSDPTFKQAEATWLSQKQNLPIAIAGALPLINASAGYAREWQESDSPFNSRFLSNGFFNAYNYNLNLSQPLFNVAVWRSISGAKANVKAATATYLAAAQTLMVNTAKAYFAVLQAYDQLRYTIANKAAVYQQLITARQQFKVGLIAITGVYDAQSSYDQAVATEITDRNVLENQLENLRAITGKYYTNMAGLKKNLPLLTPVPDQIEKWVAISNQQNFALLAQIYNVKTAYVKIKQIAAGHLPVIDFNASYGRLNTTDHPLAIDNSDQQNASFGVNVNLPIFQGGLVSAQTKQARYDYVTASAQMEFVHRQTVNQTRQAFLGVISGISQVNADKQTINSARNALEATKAGYVVGTRTMVDVLSSLSTLYNTQRQYSIDQYNYLISTILLKQAAGTLSIRDLAKINRWLTKKIRLPISQERQGRPIVIQPPILSAKDHTSAPEEIDTSQKIKDKKILPILPEEDEKISPSTSVSYLKSKTTSVTPTPKITTHANLHYVIQLYAAHSKAEAQKFIQQHNGRPLSIVKHDGWYKVIYGNFADYKQALVAEQKLPVAWKTNKPWIYKLASLTRDHSDHKILQQPMLRLANSSMMLHRF